MELWELRRLAEQVIMDNSLIINRLLEPSVMITMLLVGHLGAERVTVQNLAVVKVDAENNLIAIKGAIPGPNGGIVVIRDSVKA